MKNTGFKYRESGLLVQALKTLGKERVDQAVIETLRKRLDAANCERIIKDTRTAIGWILQIIKQVCGELMDKVARFSPDQRRELLSETAARMGMTPAVAEKDFWVTWVLDRLFRQPELARQTAILSPWLGEL